MTISLKNLQKQVEIEKVIIHSLDCALYQVSVIIHGQELYLADEQGKLLRSHNKMSLQTLFTGLPVKRMVLRQQSAYDEMVGQPLRAGDNCLEVSLGNSEMGTVDR
ncbi:DUF6482 family protein [Oceanospirillum sp.]|uniref:DUF6482 family protein n=1 Tax=Oceanospirillum sp. TaxID=2021254 RepID=UPI003A944CA0